MLDTYAIIELFRGGEKGSIVKKLIERDSDIHISVLSLFETGTVLEREIGTERARDYLRSLQTYYSIVDIDQEISLSAVELRRSFGLPAIDCLIYASARSVDAKVVSGCRHFREIAEQDDVIII